MKRILKKLSAIILITAVFFTCAGTSFAAAFTYNSAVEKKIILHSQAGRLYEAKNAGFR